MIMFIVLGIDIMCTLIIVRSVVGYGKIPRQG